MWIVGAGETTDQGRTERWREPKRKDPGVDDIRQTTRREVKEPPTPRPGQCAGRLPRRDGKERDQDRERAATEGDHAGRGPGHPMCADTSDNLIFLILIIRGA